MIAKRRSLWQNATLCHGAVLGRSLESTEKHHAELEAALAYMHEVDRARVESGEIASESLHAMPPEVACRMTVEFHPDALERFEIDR